MKGGSKGMEEIVQIKKDDKPLGFFFLESLNPMVKGMYIVKTPNNYPKKSNIDIGWRIKQIKCTVPELHKKGNIFNYPNTKRSLEKTLNFCVNADITYITYMKEDVQKFEKSGLKELVEKHDFANKTIDDIKEISPDICCLSVEEEEEAVTGFADFKIDNGEYDEDEDEETPKGFDGIDNEDEEDTPRGFDANNQ